ncbi:MAG: RidA family protein [Hyphomicrobiales bacterium]|nr:RidA family protein [Hyphomicrobiales bacterium]MBV9112719.1 RidA family protein [Hyphomicrobiales bacterium]MBV9521100.1 RidA family protein [Hyphomicrobiales bacterium]
MINFVNPPELSSPTGYSHVAEVRGGRLVYISGQIALDAQGKLVGKGDLEAQADQVFRNLGAALASVGCTARNVVKFTVFMRDVKDLAAYRRARDRFVGEGPRPASTLVEISKLVSEDFLIEIEAVAAA